MSCSSAIMTSNSRSLPIVSELIGQCLQRTGTRREAYASSPNSTVFRDMLDSKSYNSESEPISIAADGDVVDHWIDFLKNEPVVDLSLAHIESLLKLCETFKVDTLAAAVYPLNYSATSGPLPPKYSALPPCSTTITWPESPPWRCSGRITPRARCFVVTR